MPPDWNESPISAICILMEAVIRTAYATAVAQNFSTWIAVAENFSTWIANRQQPYLGICVTAAGFKCRDEYCSTHAKTRLRPDLFKVFTGNKFKMLDESGCVASNEPGVLPQYLDPVDFSPLHPEPESLLNRRITFPDATGTVSAVISALPQAYVCFFFPLTKFLL